MSDTWTEGGSYEPGRVVRTTVSIRVRRKWWEWLLRRPVQYRQEDRYYRAFHRDDPADMAGPDARLRLPYRLGLQQHCLPTRREGDVLMADPRPDAEQVIGAALHKHWADPSWPEDECRCCALHALDALRSANIPVGPVDALRYAEERLLEDANVEAASRVYERSTWEGLDAGRGRDYERRDALDDSRAALTAAFRSARGEGT